MSQKTKKYKKEITEIEKMEDEPVFARTVLWCRILLISVFFYSDHFIKFMIFESSVDCTKTFVKLNVKTPKMTVRRLSTVLAPQPGKR